MKQFLWRDYLSAIVCSTSMNTALIDMANVLIIVTDVWHVVFFAPLGARRKHEKKSVSYFRYSGRQAKTREYDSMTIFSYFRFVRRRAKTRKYDKVAKIRGAKVRHGMNQPP
jgi:hypothetical protein